MPLSLAIASALFLATSTSQGKGGSATLNANPDKRSEYQTKRALLIGVNSYPNAPGYDLAFARADALALSEVLIQGYNFEDVRVLLDSDATKEKILSGIARLTRESAAEDFVLIYFSCHGETRLLPNQKKVGFFLPSDIKFSEQHPPLQDYLQYAIRMDQIASLLKSSKARHVAIVGDSCFSGLMAAGDNKAGGKPVGALEEDMVAHFLSKPAFRLIAACDSVELAKEDRRLGHSVFTAMLLDVLRNRSQWVNQPFELSSVFSEVRTKVLGYTNKAQEPGIDNLGTTSEIVLRPKKALGAIAITLPNPTVEPDENFPDVPENHWAYGSTKVMLRYRLSQYPDGLFRGGRFLSRYEAAVTTWRALKALRILPPAVSKSQFPDMNRPEHWAYEALTDIKSSGITSGYPDGLFRGGRPITREEAAGLIFAAFRKHLASPDSLSAAAQDLEPGSATAKIVQTLQHNGVLSSFPDGLFRSKRPASRYEWAALLANAMKLVQETRGQ